MSEVKDPRNNCTNCLSIYGLEKPKMHAIRDSKNFIALTGDDLNQPSLIMIVPKHHKKKVSELMSDKSMKAEADGLIMDVLHRYDNEKACCWKYFSITWKNGTEAIKFSEPFPRLWTHAHAEISIAY